MQAPCTQPQTGTLSMALGQGGGPGGRRPRLLLMPLGTLPPSLLAPNVFPRDPLHSLGPQGPPSCLWSACPTACPGHSSQVQAHQWGLLEALPLAHPLQSQTRRHDSAVPGPRASRDSWRTDTSLCSSSSHPAWQHSEAGNTRASPPSPPTQHTGHAGPCPPSTWPTAAEERGRQ